MDQTQNAIFLQKLQALVNFAVCSEEPENLTPEAQLESSEGPLPVNEIQNIYTFADNLWMAGVDPKVFLRFLYIAGETG